MSSFPVNALTKSKGQNFTIFGPVISLKVDQIKPISNQFKGTTRRVTGKKFHQNLLSSFPVNVLTKSFTDARTDGRMHTHMHGQPENIMPPAPKVGEGIKTAIYWTQ